MKKVIVKQFIMQMEDADWALVSKENELRKWGYSDKDIYHLALALRFAIKYSDDLKNETMFNCIKELHKVVTHTVSLSVGVPELFEKEVREFCGALLDDANFHESACLLRNGLFDGIIRRYEENEKNGK